MSNTNKSVKIATVINYIFMGLLVAVIIFLPGIVTWYVEYKGREASLPTTIMLTCYPCVPFAGYALWSLKKILKNVSTNKVFHSDNTMYMKRLSICSFAIMFIMFFAGRHYLPFYVLATCAGFIGLITYIVKVLFSAAIEENESRTKHELDEFAGEEFSAEDEAFEENED